jgi:hypothetical protein
MAFTQVQLDAIDKAIATGVLSVKHGEETTVFRSMPEMLEARRLMTKDLNDIPRTTVASFNKGF